MKNLFIIILCVCSIANAFSQNVNGKVFELLKDGSYEPVFGANVYWQDTQVGTVTDDFGNYQLPEAISFPATLKVSYVGYELISQEFVDDLFIFYLSSSLELGEVNIKGKQTASRYSTINSLNIQTLSTKELEKAACCNLSESFETNASVDVAFNDGVSGAKKIKMLGLDGIYTQVTHENMPLIRGLSNSYGLSHVPGSWIESIQIIKGSGSVVNGFESFTGQINLQYFNPENADKLFLNFYVNGEGKIENNLILSKRNGDWQSNLFTHVSYHGIDHDRNNDNFLDMPKTSHFNFLNRWKYVGNSKLGMQFFIRGFVEDRVGGTISEINNPFLVDIENKLIEISSKTGFIMPEQIGKSLGLQSSFRTHSQDAKFGSKDFKGLQESVFLNLIRQTFILDCKHKLKYGISYYADRMSDNLNSSQNLSLYSSLMQSRVDLMTGLFSEYNYLWGESLSLTAGIRSDYYNKTEKVYILPRINLKYNPSENTALRLSAGRSLRIANPITDNISLLASNRDIIFEDALCPEIAWNYGFNITTNFKILEREAGFNFDFYRTDFENQVVVNIEDQNILSFSNLNQDLSFANSLQIDFSYELIDRFDLKLAYKINDVKSTYSDVLMQVPLLPRERALLNFSYSDFDENWIFDFTCNYIGKSRIPNHSMINKEFSNPFNLFNTQITRKWKEFEVYTGAENLFSTVQENPIIYNYDPSSENFDASLIWAPVMGRVLYLGLRYRIK